MLRLAPTGLGGGAVHPEGPSVTLWVCSCAVAPPGVVLHLRHCSGLIRGSLVPASSPTVLGKSQALPITQV